MEKLEKLKQAQELMSEVASHDLDADKIWLSHLFQSIGFLKDSIRELESGKIRRHSDMMEN